MGGGGGNILVTIRYSQSAKHGSERALRLGLNFSRALRQGCSGI